jgi:hypothetical protein
MDSRYLRDKEELKSPKTPAEPVDNDRRALLTAGLVGGAVAATALMSGAAHAQGTTTPIGTDKPFWPHPKWGKDDVAGPATSRRPRSSTP